MEGCNGAFGPFLGNQPYGVVQNFTKVMLNLVDMRKDVGNICFDMVTMMCTVNCQTMLIRIEVICKM
jgi:hypothetical protein